MVFIHFPFSFGGGWWVDVDVHNAEGPDWLGFLVFFVQPITWERKLEIELHSPATKVLQKV